MKTTYSEKLKDPLWQKKRLSVLSRDKFTCKLCGDKETTLHIHHKAYEYGKEPWDYDMDNFQTLCEPCHSLTELLKKYDCPGVLQVRKRKKENRFLIYALKSDGGLFICLYENKAIEILLNLSAGSAQSLAKFISKSQRKFEQEWLDSKTI